MKPTIQRRYKLYRRTLLGKILADEYVDVFNKKDDEYNHKNKYSGSFVENDKWWIAAISKLEISKRFNYSYSDNDYYDNDVAFSNTLYMHKYRNMAVLKTSLITYGQWTNTSNIVNNVFMRMLRSLGYFKADFEREEKLYDRWRTRTVKILIPEDKTEDDLVHLLQSIEKYNNFIRDNTANMDNWDNLPIILKAVKKLVIPENNE